MKFYLRFFSYIWSGSTNVRSYLCYQSYPCLWRCFPTAGVTTSLYYLSESIAVSFFFLFLKDTVCLGLMQQISPLMQTWQNYCHMKKRPRKTIYNIYMCFVCFFLRHWLATYFVIWYGVPYMTYDIFAMYLSHYYRFRIKGHEEYKQHSLRTVNSFVRREFLLVLHHIALLTILLPVTLVRMRKGGRRWWEKRGRDCRQHRWGPVVSIQWQ